MGQAAKAQGALGLTSHEAQESQALQVLLQAIDPALQGRYDAPVGGQEAKQAKAGSREIDQPVERFASAHVVLESPIAAQ